MKMPKLAMALAVSLATLLVTSCSSSSSSNWCPDLATDTVLDEPSVIPLVPWEVVYSVTAVRGASVSSLQYRNVAGTMVTVNNPTLPWTVTLTGVPAGTRVTLTVVAAAPPGWVSADVDAYAVSGGYSDHRSFGDACGDFPPQ